MTDADAGAGADGIDDAKRKFREALDRKKAGSGGVAGRRGAGPSQSRSHGAAENRREFRRKSG